MKMFKILDVKVQQDTVQYRKSIEALEVNNNVNNNIDINDDLDKKLINNKEIGY